MRISSNLPGAFLLLCLSTALQAQQSNFDTNNENWRASGDPLSPTPAWEATGGNPGGFIRVTDAATGGTWYFEAPNAFKGNKCDAYERYFRWDQFTSDTTNQQAFGGNPDLIIEGGGITLAFDNAQNPGLTWTHYDVLLREDAGWRLNNNNGPVPTQAQFRSALANITALRIRGEYRAQADFGGLDNVVLESTYRFDLDGDNSSGATDDGFAADTLCDPFSPVVDPDAVFIFEKNVDSVVLRLLLAQNPATESLSAGPLPANIGILQNAPGWITLINTGGATPVDFLAALQTVRYADISPNPKPGERLVAIRAYTECGDMGVRYAYLPVFPPANAGLPADTLLCAGGPALNLFQLLGGSPDPGGYWHPTLPGGLFDPSATPPGVFTYILAGAGTCPGDSARVTVAVEQPFALRPDTTICLGDTLLLTVPTGLADWQWSNGSRDAALEVTAPGSYRLSGQTANCTFEDSVAVNVITCETCPVYAPNVFSPNADGWNDYWQLFLPCPWQAFRLELFDRWGNLVFAASDPEQPWDGSRQGKPLDPGVYIWYAEWTGELFGAQTLNRQSGSVTLLR